MSEVGKNDSAETEDSDAVEVIIEDDEGMDCENDSDDDSGNSVNEEEEKERLVATIEAKISQNPYVYEDHVELINLLSELGDPHRLSKSYDRLNSWCVLEPDQWVHRLHVIRTLAESGSDEENIKKAHEVFEQAIREVYNYQVYMQWCRFVIDLELQGASVNRGGIYEPRRILAKALDMAGSDPLHGHKFWEKVLDYEMQKLTQIDSNSPIYEDQVHRVFDVYAGWLSKPLLENDGLLKRFENFVSIYEFIKEDDVKEVLNDYQTAQALLQKILPFEEKLTMFGTTTKAVSIYIGYINKVNELVLLGGADAAIIKNLLPMLYDRASYECCSLLLNSREKDISSLCETLLMDYAEFARRRDEREYFDLVLERIIKRWSKSSRFWIMKMREQERRNNELEKIRGTLEMALLSGIPAPEDSVELWTAYLEAVKRHTDFAREQDLDRLRDTFRLAWDSLGSNWGDRADPFCTILLFWARIEYKIIGDSGRGRDLFEEVFECGANKTMCNVWLELINMESRRVPAPSPHKISELFKRALRFVMDWPRGLCDAWLNHERDHGSVDSLEDCKRTCKDVIDEWEKRVEERRLAKLHERLAYAKRAYRGKPLDAKDVGKKRHTVGRDQDIVSIKRPRVDTPRKAPSDGRQLRSAEKLVRDVGSTASDSDIKQKQLMPPPPAPGSPPPGYKRPPQAITNIPESTPEMDKTARTVFVSNLGFKVNEDNLKEVLAGFGEIADLRVVADVKAFGGSICYCEYVNKSSAQVAIANDRKLLDSRPMFISQYSEERSARRPKFKYSTTVEKNKLFVRNLPFEDCTREKLSKVFAPHGRLKDVRVVTRKDGTPKGLAYVDYEDEESAKKAFQATNGLLMGDREIIVAFSAPPAKSGLSSSDSTLGSGRRDPASATKGRGKGRTQLSAFIPRALQTPTQFAEKQGNGATESTSAAASTGKLSNTDFRNMVLAKK